MNQEEMLKELGVSRREFDDLLTKFHGFVGSLDERQQAVVKRSLPTITEAAASFGPDVKPDDLRRLFKEGSGELPILGGGAYFVCIRHPKK
jgi:hypothetical protein